MELFERIYSDGIQVLIFPSSIQEEHRAILFVHPQDYVKISESLKQLKEKQDGSGQSLPSQI